MVPAAERGRPRVLFLSGLQIHPTQSGGNLRSFGLASALAHHGLEVFVHSMVGRKREYLARQPSATQTWPEGIPEYVDRGPGAFVAQYGSYALSLPPIWLTRYLKTAAVLPGQRLLSRPLRERLAWCDAVVADFPFVHPIFKAPAARGRIRVLSTHNLEHEMFPQAGGLRSRWLRAHVRALELEAARTCDVLVACCAADQQFFAAHAPPRRSVLVPNGIDPRRFQGLDALRAPTRRELGLADDVKVFLFTASRYGPNQEAFDYLVAFAREHEALLAAERIHLLAVGNVAAQPLRLPGFTATGRVGAVEPYFAAADAALNPLSSGAGTNVKMGEFMAMRLPIVCTAFGARGFVFEDGRTGFLFEKSALAPVLSRVRRMFDEEPARLRRLAEEAYARNASAIDMDACAAPLVEALREAWDAREGAARTDVDARRGSRLH